MCPNITGIVGFGLNTPGGTNFELLPSPWTSGAFIATSHYEATANIYQHIGAGANCGDTKFSANNSNSIYISDGKVHSSSLALNYIVKA